jgi:catechol 2,3-dioxygenase-like lactoylglutathione lyase family enzyme
MRRRLEPAVNGRPRTADGGRSDELAAPLAAPVAPIDPGREPLRVAAMDHLAIPVRDQERSRGFYERYFGFGARPARRYDDGVLMLYDGRGFALALGPTNEPIARPDWMHFGVGLPDRDAVLALRERLAADGVELVEAWDEPDYVSVKCRDPEGYIVEASWEP